MDAENSIWVLILRVSVVGHTLAQTASEENGDLQQLSSTATSQIVTSSQRRESVAKTQYFFDAILLCTNKCLASLSNVRLKQQERVSLLSIHSHFIQDSTSSFLDLSQPSCTCLFEYKGLLMAFSFWSWGIFLLIVIHTFKTCVAMNFLLHTFATLSFSIWVTPLRSSQQQVMRSSQETLCPQSQFGCLEQASPLPNKCYTCRENSVLIWSMHSKLSKRAQRNFGALSEISTG